ncbi:MAG: cobalamin biosynthesis protein CbiD [Lachnospiraceae bacterium]|nr:cobalamin biosynthesis protein CbiD [Lachnospiraceae bacterium]
MEYYMTKNQKRLRCGITTGTCAAAAAKAAATLLLLGEEYKSVTIHTPKGLDVPISVFLDTYAEDNAEFTVKKDSGDDPDVTNHAEITVHIKKIADSTECPPKAFYDNRFPNLVLDGGVGVGRVQRGGLEQQVGQAAINEVPREMIFQAVYEVCRQAENYGKLYILVKVPQGKELAKRTFNPKLGIEGGISILGTSGIVEPMSEKAIVDTIEAEIRQLSARGKKNLLVTPGNYGQKYISEYLHLDLEKSIKCSNYIGETIDLAVAYGMKNFLLVGNLGKLVKLAAGIMNTHSKVADARCEILAVHSVLCGGNPELVLKIMQCINTEEILQILEQNNLREKVLKSLCEKIDRHISHRAGNNALHKLNCGVVLFSETFGYLGQTAGADALIRQFGKEK